ncbi:hypothetical protein BDV93DRAFT_230622 [Ceratobasidium sp. AG-I]|nr:hypothetical protein BDV93DRAFT_230622 [Ceratobasidium sp. AG-I]
MIWSSPHQPTGANTWPQNNLMYVINIRVTCLFWIEHEVCRSALTVVMLSPTTHSSPDFAISPFESSHASFFIHSFCCITCNDFSHIFLLLPCSNLTPFCLHSNRLNACFRCTSSFGTLASVQLGLWFDN